MGKIKKNIGVEIERNKINNIKFLMIYLVVFGHFIGRQTDMNIIAKELYKIIYLFHMPIFVIISGYLYGKSSRKTLIDNINTTLIPFLIFHFIYLMFKIVTGNIKNLNNLYLEIITPGSVHWYILCLFYWKLIILKLKNRKLVLVIVVIIPFLTGLVPFIDNRFALAKGFNYFIYFYIGYISSKRGLLNILDYMDKKLMLVISIITMVLVVIFYNKITIDQITVATSYRYMGISVWNGMINRLVIYSISLFISSIIIKLISSKKNTFTYLGERTISIYFLHNYFIYVAVFSGVYSKVLIGNLGIPILSIISLIVTLILGSNISLRIVKKLVNIFRIRNRKIGKDLIINR